MALTSPTDKVRISLNKYVKAIAIFADGTLAHQMIPQNVGRKQQTLHTATKVVNSLQH